MTGVVMAVASLAGVLAAMTLLGALVWVVGIALLGFMVRRRDRIVLAVAKACGLFAVASVAPDGLAMG